MSASALSLMMGFLWLLGVPWPYRAHVSILPIEQFDPGCGHNSASMWLNHSGPAHTYKTIVEAMAHLQHRRRVQFWQLEKPCVPRCVTLWSIHRLLACNDTVRERGRGAERGMTYERWPRVIGCKPAIVSFAEYCKSQIPLRYPGRRQVGSWSQTCSELEFGLSSSSL